MLALIVVFVAVSATSCQDKAKLEAQLRDYSKNSYDLSNVLLLSTQEIALMVNNPSEASSHIRNIKLVRERVSKASAFLEGDIPTANQTDATSLKEITDHYFLILDDAESGFTALYSGNSNTATYYFNRAAYRVEILNILMESYLESYL